MGRRVDLPGKGSILGATQEGRERRFCVVFGEGMEGEREGAGLIATIILFLVMVCGRETI